MDGFLGFGWPPLPLRPGAVCCTLEGRENHIPKGRTTPQPLGEGDRRSLNCAGALPILVSLGPAAERGFEPIAIRSIRLEVVAGWKVLGVVGIQGVLPWVHEPPWRQGTMANQGAAEG